MQRTMRILVCAAILAFGAQIAGSQGITFDATDVQAIFAVGNTITYRIDTLTTSANIGAPGQTSWNFVGFNTTSKMTLKSLPVASTAYATAFPQATHALRDTAFTYSFIYAALGTTVTLKGTGFVYYALTGNLVNYGLRGGGNAYLFGNPYPAQGQWLNSPASVDYNLPLQFSKTWTTDYTETISGNATLGSITLPIGPIDTRHTLTYTVDAYGTLTLPGVQLQRALRIRKLDRFVSSTTNGLRVGYIFVAKNGATVQMTANDTSATSGTVSVSSVQWTEGMWEETLPIELASFTATQWDGKSVKLEWTTLSETNNFGFYIQKKGPDDGEFNELPGSFVAGHGTTVVPQKYSYLDIPKNSGAWWYRLKQVDLDGAVHLSEPTQVRAVTSVQEIIPTSYELAQNYPNPFNPVTTIGFRVQGGGSGETGSNTRNAQPGTQHVLLSVYDLLGREVAVLVDERKAPGSYEVKFDGNELSSGVYFYRIRAGDFVQTRKLLLAR